MTTHDFSYSTAARLIHLGLAVFGIAAFLTGELAEDGGRSGYLIHAYLGLSLAAVMLLRMGTGFSQSRSARVSPLAAFFTPAVAADSCRHRWPAAFLKSLKAASTGDYRDWSRRWGC